jgi:hypothetical protein
MSTPVTTTRPRWRHLTRGGTPSQPARYAAITDHLLRDHERDHLTLRGPDLRYWLQYAQPGDPVRDWVTVALDARITAADAARLAGAQADDRHVCQQCAGRGCKACGQIGLTCPTCRGHRWLTDGEPDTYQLALTACPGCMATSPIGYTYAPSIEARTIQRFLDRRGAPS